MLAAVAAAVFVGLACGGRDRFVGLVWRSDTITYLDVTRGLVERGELVPTFRTLGYPLFLALGWLVGGEGYSLHVAVAIQLALLLVFTDLFWRLLAELVPRASSRLRAFLTVVFFWIGLGQATIALSDFLAALFFGVFVYGMLLRRGWRWALLAGACLALANLTRPTFQFFVVLVPLLAWIAGRVTRRVPWPQVGIYALFWAISLAVTLGHAHVHRDRRDLAQPGPDRTFVTHSLYDVYRSVYHPELQDPDNLNAFRTDLSRLAGRPFADLTRSQREEFAKRLFWEEFRRDPARYFRAFALRVVLSTATPVEGPLWVLRKCGPQVDRAYEVFRKTVIWPLWGLLLVLCLFPPLWAGSGMKSFYGFLLVVSMYVIGVSSLLSFAGERMRYPLTFLMLPVAAANLAGLARRFRREGLRAEPSGKDGGESGLPPAAEAR